MFPFRWKLQRKLAELAHLGADGHPPLTILNGASIQLFNGGSEAVAGAEGNHMEVAGFVTGLNMDTFKVGGTPVKSGTVPLPAGFANNVKVLVKGTLTGGVIMASQVMLQ